jgi:hypothetical protein
MTRFMLAMVAGLSVLLWPAQVREIETPLAIEPEIKPPLLCAQGGGTCAWPILPGRRRI